MTQQPQAVYQAPATTTYMTAPQPAQETFVTRMVEEEPFVENLVIEMDIAGPTVSGGIAEMNLRPTETSAIQPTFVEPVRQFQEQGFVEQVQRSPIAAASYIQAAPQRTYAQPVSQTMTSMPAVQYGGAQQYGGARTMQRPAMRAAPSYGTSAAAPSYGTSGAYYR